MSDSFGARGTLEVGSEKYEIFRLDALQSKYDVARLPYSLKVLLENLLRNEADGSVAAEDVENAACAGWRPTSRARRSPSRRPAC